MLELVLDQVLMVQMGNDQLRLRQKHH